MSPTFRPRNVPALLGTFVAMSLVAGVLSAGLVVPAVGASGLAANSAVNAFNDLPDELAETPMAATTTVLAADGSVITTFFDENRDVVPLEKISPFMQNAIVAIEDERFYEHGGVDAQGLLRALVVNQVSGGNTQGASTLTQQLVKNMLKEQAYLAGDDDGVLAASEKSNSRKLKEIRLATALEKRKTKKEILEAYLNIAWFGGTVNGVEAAAKYYFDTTAAKLTLPQSALLAGMVQNPRLYDISDDKLLDKARRRRNTVLNRMFRQGMIDGELRREAASADLDPDITPTYQGCANAGTSAYFCDYVYNLITKSDGFSALGKTEEERVLAVSRGGYTIHTTLEPKLLEAAWKAAKEAIPPDDKSRVATASVTVQPGTGKVLSLIQNKYYRTEDKRENTTVNYSTDYRYGGSSGFLTGSTFKPVVLATWLKSGKQLYDTVSGAEGSLPVSSFTSCGEKLKSSETWDFHNAGDSSRSGGMSVWDATANSVNGAYVRMENQLDLCDVKKTAQALGMHLAAPSDRQCPDEKKTTQDIPDCVPAIVLGVASQSPLTMANAYATFAASGKYCEPIAVTAIEDRHGVPVKIPEQSCKQAIDKDVANTVTLGLSRALTNGTASSTGALASGQKASGKTGTTNGSQDTWFVGYTPQLSTSVWVGPETVDGEREPMRDVTINGHTYGEVFGGSIAAPLWKKIMEAALKGEKVVAFPAADSSLVGSPPVVHRPSDGDDDDDDHGTGATGGGNGDDDPGADDGGSDDGGGDDGDDGGDDGDDGGDDGGGDDDGGGEDDDGGEDDGGGSTPIETVTPSAPTVTISPSR